MKIDYLNNSSINSNSLSVEYWSNKLCNPHLGNFSECKCRSNSSWKQVSLIHQTDQSNKTQSWPVMFMSSVWLAYCRTQTLFFSSLVRVIFCSMAWSAVLHKIWPWHNRKRSIEVLSEGSKHFVALISLAQSTKAVRILLPRSSPKTSCVWQLWAGDSWKTELKYVN